MTSKTIHPADLRTIARGNGFTVGSVTDPLMQEELTAVVALFESRFTEAYGYTESGLPEHNGDPGLPYLYRLYRTRDESFNRCNPHIAIWYKQTAD